MTSSQSHAEAATGHDGFTGRFLLVYIALFVPFAVGAPYLQQLLRLRGLSREQIGWVTGMFELMAVAAPPIWGILSDWTRSRRLLLLAAVCGTLPAFLAFGLVSGSLVAACAVALLFGFFYRPLIPLTDGITFRHIAVRGGDYGRVRIGGSLGFIGTVLLLEALGISRTASGGAILLAMACALLIQASSILLLPPCPDSPEAAVPDAVPDAAPDTGPGLRALLTRAFICFTAAAFLGRAAMMGYYGYFTLFLREEMGFDHAGLIWVLGPLSEMPVICFSGWIMRRIGVKRLFALGLLGCTVRLLGIGLAPAIWALLPLQLLHSLTFGAFHCASVTYVSRSVPARLQSTAQTLFAGITIGAGGIVGSVAGGMLADALSFRGMYLALSVVAGVGLVLLLAAVPPLAVDSGNGEGRMR